jgi:hypothetical protein
MKGPRPPQPGPAVLASHTPRRRRGMSLSGRVDARPATKLCILRIMTPAEGRSGPPSAQENYINGFSGTHLLAGDLGLRKTQYFQQSKRALSPS